MPDTDQVAARLAEIRERIRCGTIGFTAPLNFVALKDAPALLKAVEDALKLAADWEEAGTKLHEAADRAAERGALPERTNLMDGRAQAQRDCAQALREHVSTALLGEGDGSEH